MGLRLEACRTGGEKDTGEGATRAVTVDVGTYEGTEATTGLVGVEGGVTRTAGGDTGGVWVMGVTTLTGLWGLGRTKGGGGLTVGEEGRVELIFEASSVAVVPSDGGFEGGENGETAAGMGGSFGEEEVEVMMETVVLGVLFWTGLSGGMVTEEVTTNTGGTVFTTAMAGKAPTSVESRLTAAETLL